MLSYTLKRLMGDIEENETQSSQDVWPEANPRSATLLCSAL